MREPEIQYRDEYRQARIVVSLAAKGDSDPFTASSSNFTACTLTTSGHRLWLIARANSVGSMTFGTLTTAA